MKRGLVALALVGCRPIPPPPIVPMHAGTEAEPRGATTAMVVLGVVQAGDFLFSSSAGVGVALRVEHQAYAQTALGVQLAGGHGAEGGRDPARRTLIALDAYGRRSLADWTAASYGVGLSWFSTGLVALSGHAGLAVSLPNDYAVPALRLGLGGSVPILPGDPFGSVVSPTGGPCFACEHSSPGPLVEPGGRPTAELFLLANLGVLVPLGDTGNRLSLDLGFAHARDQTVTALSAADAQR